MKVLWRILGVEIYEVGDIYLNMSGNNPGNRFKGTWELIAQGRTLVGIDTTQTEFDAVGKTGGAKTHTLTNEEMPEHSHTLFGNTNTYASSSSDYYQPQSVFKGYANGSRVNIYKNTSSTNTAGGDQPHNNLPPYLVCYIWQRTS